MKKIAIEIQDDIYAYLVNYSAQTNRSVEDLAAEALSSSLSMLDYNRTVREMEERQEQWCRERGFPIYGKNEAIPYSLR